MCTGIGMAWATFYTLRLATKNPDVTWSRKNNPEPWQEYHNKQYKVRSWAKHACRRDIRWPDANLIPCLAPFRFSSCRRSGTIPKSRVLHPNSRQLCSMLQSPQLPHRMHYVSPVAANGREKTLCLVDLVCNTKTCAKFESQHHTHYNRT